jgi:hypothetical protein
MSKKNALYERCDLRVLLIKKVKEGLISDFLAKFYARVAEFGLGAGLQTLLHGSIPSRAPICGCEVQLVE